MIEKTQLELLADYIMSEIDGEPSRGDKGAGSCAVRLLKSYRDRIAELEQQADENNDKLMIALAENDFRRKQQRPCIRHFAEKMEFKLRENDHKGGWKNCDAASLVKRLREETDELEVALEKGTVEEICREAADVGNFAMMIFDNAK